MTEALGVGDFTRYEFLHAVVHEDVRLAVCAWLKQHGIDPRDVCTPGWIELQFDTRRVFWEAYKLNERGDRYFEPGTDEAAREVHSIQLESRPLPFPRLAVAGVPE